MGYSSASEARQARESLGKALETLQQDTDVPEEVLRLTQHVAKSIGALFEAEYASTEPDGKTCVKNALGTLSQTLALLQDVKSDHAAVQSTTQSLADVISVLFPLTTKPTLRPEGSSDPPTESAPPSQRPPASAPPSQRPPASAPPSQRPPASASPQSAPPESRPAQGGHPSERPIPLRSALRRAPSERPESERSPASAPPSERPASQRPVSGGPAHVHTSLLPPPAPVPVSQRRRLEANLGATTQSNFYVGFSGEIAHGGVFLATYEAFPKDTSVRMLVTLPGGFEFECDGYVRFVRDPMDFASESEPGMGVQFEGLSDKARELVMRFIRKRPPIFYDV
ncbi:MAG: hypothetical protein HKN97_13340 [Myxococcales bacterium]|nr:hypothetical protein [Myxococcales bacterium]